MTIDISIGSNGVRQSLEVNTDNPEEAAKHVTHFILNRLAAVSEATGIGLLSFLANGINNHGANIQTMLTNLQGLVTDPNQAPGVPPISSEMHKKAIDLNRKILSSFPEFLSDAFTENDNFTVHYDTNVVALNEQAGNPAFVVQYEFPFTNLQQEQDVNTGTAPVRSGIIFANGLHMGFTVGFGSGFNELLLTPWTLDGAVVNPDVINNMVYTISPDIYNGNLPTADSVKKIARKMLDSLFAVCSNFGSTTPLPNHEAMNVFMSKMLQQELDHATAPTAEADNFLTDVVQEQQGAAGEMTLPEQNEGMAVNDPVFVAADAAQDQPVVMDGWVVPEGIVDEMTGFIENALAEATGLVNEDQLPEGVEAQAPQPIPEDQLDENGVLVQAIVNDDMDDTEDMFTLDEETPFDPAG